MSTKVRNIIITVCVIVVLVGGSFIYFKNTYNSLITHRTAVEGQWADVESQYQRRADLIPNLVSTVKGYAAHESTTLNEVVDARARATQTTVNFDDLNEQTMAQYQKSQSELSTALGRLLMVTENYPNLKADRQFQDLATQIEGTENRIATQRMRYNDAVRAYNTYLQLFPRNVIAGMFGFTPKSYFAADAGSQSAPKVEF